MSGVMPKLLNRDFISLKTKKKEPNRGGCIYGKIPERENCASPSNLVMD